MFFWKKHSKIFWSKDNLQVSLKSFLNALKIGCIRYDLKITTSPHYLRKKAVNSLYKEIRFSAEWIGNLFSKDLKNNNFHLMN